MMLSTQSIDKAVNGAKADTGDSEFFEELDKKYHFIRNLRGSGRFYNRVTPVDHFTEQKLSEKELNSVLEIVDKGYFAFFPVQGFGGFSPNYKVVDPVLNKTLFTFETAQLPSGQTFNTLAQYFMKEENVKKAKSLGVTIYDKRHYDY